MKYTALVFLEVIMPEWKCKAVLFDLDGTLVDSGASIEHLWSNWAAINHIDVSYVLSIIHGRTIEETLKMISPYFHNEESIEEIKKLAIEELSHVSPLPGAVDFLKKLPRNKFAIVTSGSRKVALPSIIGAGLPTPEVIITSEDVRIGKPEPEPYLKAAKELGILPDECLVFEDADSGIQSAIAAGMRVITVGASGHKVGNGSCDILIGYYECVNVDIDGEVITLSW